jgi:hypothetical protein
VEEGRSVANDFFEIAPLHVKELRTEQLQKSPILVPSCESRADVPDDDGFFANVGFRLCEPLPRWFGGLSAELMHLRGEFGQPLMP